LSTEGFSPLNNSYAVNWRNLKTTWDKFGIIINNWEAINKTSDESLDILKSDLSSNYELYLDDTESYTWTWMTVMNPKASCKRILELWNARRWDRADWVYKINPTGDNEFEVYCDMTTDWGGWTYATMLADTSTRNLFKTENTNKITSLDTDIETRWQISDIWRDNWDKDIMMKCKTNQTNDLKKYEIPFFIYWYKKSDIVNLERDNKTDSDANTDNFFSSINLNAKWDWNSYIIQNTYWGSWNNNSFYLIENTSWKKLFWIGSSNIFFSRGDWQWYENSPAYNGQSTSNLGQYLRLNNYCMTAIR